MTKRNKPETMRPRDAVTLAKAIRLRRDNADCPRGWITLDGATVTLANQPAGCPLTSKVTFTIADFNRLVDWYNRPQKLRATHPE